MAFNGNGFKAHYRPFVLAMMTLLLAGCGSLIEKGGMRFAANLSAAVLDSNDPVMVEAGLPSYLLLLDALALQDPESAAIRQAAASLNGAYAGAFVKEPARAAALTEKSRRYALEAACLSDESLCKIQDMPAEKIKEVLAQLDEKEDVPALYTLATSWAGWIETHSDDFNAIADLPRVELLLNRVLELDETWQNGTAHLYMGVIATAIPPALGGRPELGKAHFEKALALSNGQNLMAKVYYAKNYARGTYNRELHDQLLNEVIEAPSQAPGWTLMNQIAKREAQVLLESADDFF